MNFGVVFHLSFLTVTWYRDSFKQRLDSKLFLSEHSQLILVFNIVFIKVNNYLNDYNSKDRSLLNLPAYNYVSLRRTYALTCQLQVTLDGSNFKFWKFLFLIFQVHCNITFSIFFSFQFSKSSTPTWTICTCFLVFHSR